MFRQGPKSKGGNGTDGKSGRGGAEFFIGEPIFRGGKTQEENWGRGDLPTYRGMSEMVENPRFSSPGKTSEGTKCQSSPAKRPSGVARGSCVSGGIVIRNWKRGKGIWEKWYEVRPISRGPIMNREGKES